jgi:hypothetical protein
MPITPQGLYKLRSAPLCEGKRANPIVARFPVDVSIHLREERQGENTTVVLLDLFPSTPLRERRR